MSTMTRFPMTVRLWFVRGGTLLASGALVLAIAGTASAAGAFTVGTLTQVPDKPLAATCASLVQQQTDLGSVNFPDSEVEPYVATDPTNASHLIGAFQQDRWNDGGANGLTTVYSTNGGRSWTLATRQPLFSTCAGAPK